VENKYQKHAKIIQFLKERGDIIDWIDEDITPEIHEQLVAAMEDGIVMSYCETETYMLVDDGSK
jgi:hypothetical protein